MLWQRHSTRVWETWWNSQPRKRDTAQAVQCRALQGSVAHPSCPMRWDAGQSLHPRLAQAAAMQAQAKYSTATCFIWSGRFVNFWGQGHACNTLIPGATVQRCISLGCSGHSWHTINMHRVSQVLQRRLHILLTLCLPSFPAPLSSSHSDFWETPATGGFTPLLCGYIALSSSAAHFAVTLHCTPCHRTTCHPSSSLQRTRTTQLQLFTSNLSQP